VIEGVRQIQVTLYDQRSFTARMVARDAQTDLAIIKINAPESLPLVTIGTSSDLMLGETVIAVGNAYGYHNTVTQGIISALDRAVEVTDAQKYYDLIQTDASINPGNSGGPLLNVDGEMIGVNVAVRVGAQGIGFAIPVDKVMEVAAVLMSSERIAGTWHGVIGTAQTAEGVTRYIVDRIDENSPAAQAGLQIGDVISAINHTPICRQLDVERSLLGLKPGSDVKISVRRSTGSHNVDMQLAAATRAPLINGPSDLDQEVWQRFGMRATPVTAGELGDARQNFKGGLRITAIRPNGLAERNGIRQGDILVGLHVWETVSLSNLDYILNRADLANSKAVKFFVVRESVPRVGSMPVSWR
jgi:serine protease Do